MLFIDIETNTLEITDALRVWMLGWRKGEQQGWVKSEDITRFFADLPGDEVLCGHNILNYDLPALEMVYGVCWPRSQVVDTLILSKMACSSRQSHSLAAWGETFSAPKGSFKDFESGLSEEMVQYCLQDVALTARIYEAIVQASPWVLGSCYALEMDFSMDIRRMMAAGAPFDVVGATRFLDRLQDEINPLQDQLRALVPPKRIEGERPSYYEAFGVRYRLKKDAPKEVQRHLQAGPPVSHLEDFNPGSAQQVADLFQTRYQWKPVEFTPTGRPQVSEEILSTLEYSEARLILDIKLRQNLVSKVASWKEKAVNGRIHGYVDHYGAVTGRCTHSEPNLANIPVHSPLFAECRALFKAPEGRVLVGTDAAKLELVMLAHYLFPFDDGEYAELVRSGDPHRRTLEGTGLIDRVEYLVSSGYTEEQALKALRNQAKRFIYALIYGAGDPKLGQIVEPSEQELSDIRRRHPGRVAEYERRFRRRFATNDVPAYIGPMGVLGGRLRERFQADMPAFPRLLESVQAQCETGKGLKTLTGARLFPRSKNSALNTLLQGGGAAIMKEATVSFCRGLREAYPSAFMVLHTHDEIQTECSTRDAEMVADFCGLCITNAAARLGVRLPLGYESKIGATWKATH